MTSKAEGASQSSSPPLPKCFCNWKHCRTYQKAFREYKHPLFNGVVKMKFTRSDPRSMALKESVDRTLHVDAQRRNDWKLVDGEDVCRYYVARHHFTEAMMERYWEFRKGYDWTEPLTTRQAQNLLWSLDRQDVYRSPEGEDGADDDEDDKYVQAPNVPKDHVRGVLRELKEEYNRAKEQATVSTGRSTLSNSVTDSLKVFESKSVTDTLMAYDNALPQEQAEEVVDDDNNKDTLLAQKDKENDELRKELQECQQQLSELQSMVKQLKVDMDRNRSSDPPSNKRKQKKRGKYQQDYSSDEEEESSSDDDDDEEEEDWYHAKRDSNPQSDDEETISTLHINGEADGSASGSGRAAQQSRTRGPVRKTSIHSRRSIRRNSVHSRRESVHSRSRHSIRRDSYHSRRSMRGGMDDGASVVSRQSLASVSPSIKSLPREIELMDDEEEDIQGKDDYSFFDDSYRKTDDDARSVGSRSAASRASRRSIVSGQRSRGRNSRRPGQGSQSAQRKRGTKPGNVPHTIDLSGDELEVSTSNNVSNDNIMVKDHLIVDPYGEKGVYSGALSKATKMPNGKGRLEYEKEGRWYEGDWIHGRWTGTGRLSNGDGDFYEGGLKNDHKQGYGVMKFSDGRVFEGKYVRGQMIEGKMTYQDGSVYSGSWSEGMRHGIGKCVFVDGSEYEGEFREGNFHGHGKMTWNDGGWYIGQWNDGEMHGKGKEIRPDGTLRHDGEWARGQPIRSGADTRRRRQHTADH